VDQGHLIFLLNPRETVLGNAVYRLSIAPSIPEKFAVKVESCFKSHQILDDFCLPKFWRGSTPKGCTCVITPPSGGSSGGKVSWSYYHYFQSYKCAFAKF